MGGRSDPTRASRQQRLPVGMVRLRIAMAPVAWPQRNGNNNNSTLGSLVAAMATVPQTMLLPAKLSICHGRSIVDWWRCMIADGTPSLVLLVRAVSQMSLSLGSGPAASACFFALPQLPSIYPLLRFSSSSSSSLLGSSAVACPDLRVCARSSVDPPMQVTCYQKSNDTVAEKALSTHLS